MPIEPIIDRFADLLQARLMRNYRVTEDSIRYTFFAAALSSEQIDPGDIELEATHPGIPRAEIDTVIHGVADQDVAVEFKYDRPLPGGQNAPRTQRAGQVFEDVRRLTLLPDDRNYGPRLLVYTVSGEMVGYFENPANGLNHVFALRVNGKLQLDRKFFANKSPSFMRECGGAAFGADLICMCNRQLAAEHQLRIYAIRAAK